MLNARCQSIVCLVFFLCSVLPGNIRYQFIYSERTFLDNPVNIQAKLFWLILFGTDTQAPTTFVLDQNKWLYSEYLFQYEFSAIYNNLKPEFNLYWLKWTEIAKAPFIIINSNRLVLSISKCGLKFKNSNSRLNFKLSQWQNGLIYLFIIFFYP